ncbi:MAG: UDP-N-acetylmuramoyl-L-alanine--D-glutamate ligase [Chloroflexi bacterium]|nr:UDP-N-acetylmuramoyl-L-alanine--D-glutamate ligase [Chloroflexota bacterium]
MNWKNQRVLIIGAARQGLALARYLSEEGAEVILTDLRSEKDLIAERESLSEYSIYWVLGEHPLRLLEGTTLVCPSGGVPLTIPLLLEAKKQGIPFSNDAQIFLQAAPCKVIGITGSAGKTTATTLVHLMAKAAVKKGIYKQAFIGGNIGNPLIADLDNMTQDDIVVMELSSFQLEQFSTSPKVAALLNITPNHLDRHVTMEAYTKAKQNILKFQNPEDFAILGREDQIAWGSSANIKGNILSFGHEKIEIEQFGTFIHEDHIWIRYVEGESQIMPVDEVALLGDHNLLNVLAACAIAAAAGLPIETMRTGINSFEGIPHRLEFVRSWGVADWYNDSIATAPERSMAGILSFDQSIVLLAGGRDKDLPWDDFAILVAEKVDHIILFGEAVDIILTALNNSPGDYSVSSCTNLASAVDTASQIVSPGDVVLFSPGGTSYDEFFDFAERGNKYIELVNTL